MVKMRIIHFELNSRLENQIGPLVAAIGFFDGLHKGHKQLVDEAVKQAKLQNTQSALITFSPAPVSVLTNQPENLLTTLDERSNLAKEYGIDVLIIIKFNKELSQQAPELFYEKVIKTLNIKHLVSGEDFRFGYKGSGTVQTLKNINDLKLSVISDYKYAGKRISSTRIKDHLALGEIVTANKLLGYSYQLNGFVMHGRKKGRTLGFPTLNLSIEESKFIPKDGVYIGVSVIQGKNYMSTINIGHNPTVNTVKYKSIESYVHNYDQDTYGQRVTFKLLKRIRDEKTFGDVQQLINEMHKDIDATNAYFHPKRRRCFNIETI